MPPSPYTVSRMAQRAIAYCQGMYEAEMALVAPGGAVTPEAQSWRVEATAYHLLLKQLRGKPKPKGAGK